MTAGNTTAQTMTAREEAVLGWAPCPTCWGQRRIWERTQAANGEGSILVATTCSGCVGVGEVLR